MVDLPWWAFTLVLIGAWFLGILIGSGSVDYDAEGLTPRERDIVDFETRWMIGVAEQDDGSGAVDDVRAARIRKQVIGSVKRRRQ